MTAPERRRGGEGRDRLSAIQAGYERWAKWTVTLLLALVVVQLGFGALSIYLVTQNSARASEAKRLAQGIQESRVDFTKRACEQQNQRHDNTIGALDAVLAAARKHASPARRIQLDASRASTVLLIGALAPRQNCDELLRGLAPATP